MLARVGTVIAEHRRAQGLTQQELADACRIQRPSLSSLEAGRRNLTFVTLVRIADALGCKPSELLRDAGL